MFIILIQVHWLYNMHVLMFVTVVIIIFISDADCDKFMEQRWGPGNDTSIRPFKIIFTEDMIQDLRQRLKNYRPSKPTFQGVGFEYGFNTEELPSWLNYWANEYPFEQREDFLNKFPQFKTNIQGLDIQFIRVVPEVPSGVTLIPLLLLHGWSQSLRDFYETIPYLTAMSGDRDFAVEVVAPSLPGFGFSDAADRPGLNAEKMAVVLRNLMHRLGHKKFYVQGGDWGAIIGSNMATLFPKEVLGYHTNFGVIRTPEAMILTILGAFYPPLVVQPDLADRMYPLTEKIVSLMLETGYLHLQATKPDTIGIVLSDSPAGFLAYLLQLISSATRRDNVSKKNGGLDHYPRATLIDNLMMYWVSNSITTSMRIYTESINKFPSAGISRKPTQVPTWVMQAKHEISYQSPAILRTKYPNLLHTTVLDDGGHYIVLEKPQLFADDVLLAIKEFRMWNKNNKT